MTTTSLPRSAPVAVLVSLLLAFTMAGCSSDEEGTNGSTVDVETFQIRVDEPAMVVLDVRTPEEYADGHLPDAVNINLESSDFESQISELDEDASYAVYCRTDNRSGVAVDKMLEDGFTDVVDLDGGIVDWQSAGGEIVTD